jgi:hypothetical protein
VNVTVQVPVHRVAVHVWPVLVVVNPVSVNAVVCVTCRVRFAKTLVLVAVTFIVTGTPEVAVRGVTCWTMGAAGGLIVTFTVAGAEAPPIFDAVTWKVSGVATATSGAVKVTLAALPPAGLKVTAGPTVCTHWNVIGAAPVAAALKVTVEFETAGLGLAVADVITGTLGGLIVTFTVTRAEAPATFVAWTVKLRGVFAPTAGAGKVTMEPSPGGLTVVRMTVGPAVWAQVNVMGVAPVAAALKVTVVPETAGFGVAVAEVTTGVVGVTVTFTVAGVEAPPPFEATTEKVAVSLAATVGAVQVTRAAFGGVGVKVPAVPAVWLQANVMVPDPVAVAVRFTVPPEATVRGLALAVTVGGCTAQAGAGAGTNGNGVI